MYEVITPFLNSQSHLQLNSVEFGRIFTAELHTKKRRGGRGLSKGNNNTNTVLVIMKVFSLQPMQLKAKEAILLTFIYLSHYLLQ